MAASRRCILHRAYVLDKGWVPAGALAPGDEIVDYNDGTPLTVISVTYEETTERVYNFEVSGTHTYFAGDVGAWVHNAQRGAGPSGKPKLHFPKHSSRKKAKDAARNRPGNRGATCHPSPRRGAPHFHGTGKNGNIVKNGVHDTFGGR